MLDAARALAEVEFERPARATEWVSRVLQTEDSRVIALGTLSLVHRSYHYERGISVCPTLMEMLGRLGSALARLVLAHASHRSGNLRTAGEISQYVNSVQIDVSLNFARVQGIQTAAMFGRGLLAEPGQPSDPLLVSITEQFLAAIYLGVGYDRVAECLRPFIPAPETLHAPPSYRNALQAYSCKHRTGRPSYEIVQETGPKHDPTYTARVSTRDGRSAEGQGPSKKQAEQAAARNYAAKYHLRLTPVWQAPGAGPLRRPSQHCIPTAHKAEILDLLSRLELPLTAVDVLSEALVHRSYCFKHLHAEHRDFTLLAVLGSFVLDAMASQDLLLLVQGWPPDEIDGFAFGKVLNDIEAQERLAGAFDRLGLGRALLVGAGERKLGIRPSIKADVVQSLFAADFLSRGRLEYPAATPRGELHLWLRSSLQAYLGGSGPGPLNEKGALQELLRLLGMEIRYDSESTGPAHTPLFRCRARLSSAALGSAFIVGHGRGSSRRSAERDLARALNTTIKMLNSGVAWPAAYTSEAGLRRLALFVLKSELLSLPQHVRTLRWRRAGLLCCGAVLDGDYRAFLRWAAKVERLFEDAGEQFPEIGGLVRFYEQVRSTSEESLQEAYVAAANSISEFLNGLDPGRSPPDTDITSRGEFRLLLSLGQASRILARDYESTTLGELADGIVLATGTTQPQLRIAVSDPGLRIWERQGSVQQVVCALVEAVVESCLPIKGSLSIGLHARHAERLMEVRIDGVPAEVDPAALAQRLEDDLLWRFLKAIVPVVSLSSGPGEVAACCGVSPPQDDASLPGALLNAFMRARPLFSHAENETIARLVHDLKNRLVAYQLAVSARTETRTGRYKARLDASTHLDAAHSLAAALQSMGRAAEAPRILAVDPVEFFREYVFSRMSTLPPNVRLDPPRTVLGALFSTAPEFLASILDNLVKNAVEAMPGGGEIRLDWVFDPVQDAMLIEIEDTGPGVDPEVLASIAAGRAVASSKRSGTGIGLLTVKTMLDRMGGELGVHVLPNRGSRWTLTLHSLENKPAVLGEKGLAEAEAMVYETQ